MTARLIVGDVFDGLATLEPGSVDLILTSPPFLALRSYLPADHPDKDKEMGSEATPAEFIDRLLDVTEALERVLAPHGSLVVELGDTYSGSGGAGGDYSDNGLREGQNPFDGSARRNRPTRGIPGVVSPGGTVGTKTVDMRGSAWPLAKSLCMLPESYRWALVYGHNPHNGRPTPPWRARNVVRWVRPNPPVGSLGDKFRPATSELVVACKSASRWFDLDAVRTPYLHPDHNDANQRRGHPTNGLKGPNLDRGDLGAGNFASNTGGAPPLDWWNIPPDEPVTPDVHNGPENVGPGSSRPAAVLGTGSSGNTPGPTTPDGLPGIEPPPPSARKPRSGMGKVDSRDAERAKVGLSSGNPGRDNNPAGAPPLDWWEISPGGYPGSHYAVWPPKLCETPIEAMCPRRVCRTCNVPSRRIVKGERVAEVDDRQRRVKASEYRLNGHDHPPELGWEFDRTTLGWSSCGCPGTDGLRLDGYHTGPGWRPGVVLDPFVGSGTTLMVAHGHGRDSIGIDLDERNVELARGRLGMFLEVSP